ncbi:MAG: tRNA pseudouridine(55) synthase TruB [Frankiales bacterium]|nr:tRNA pseudouridine(55) synthase TruB [Frankiales bacterium]
MSAPDGLLVVDKPGGWTSHDVVARSRRLARTRKVGHAGTLDPMATGVLLLGIGRATRLLGHLALTTKTYEATVRLGATTVTDDAEGDVVEVRDASAVDDDAVERALRDLRGEIAQVPSSVSAIKVDGVRSYAAVRAGREVALAARPVTVSRFDVLARRGDDLDVVVTCSSGTYVRALARDLGAALGVGGHLTALRRTQVGPFGLDAARSLEQLGAGDDAVDAAVVPLAAAVTAAFPVRELDDGEAVALSHGKRLTPTGVPGAVGAFAPDGRCIALLEDAGEQARPTVVFAPAGG